MNKAKRFSLILLVVAMLLCLCSCNETDDETTEPNTTEPVDTKTASTVELPYSREDGINPFTAKSLVNNPIMPLIYASLYTMDDTYSPKPEIASGGSVEGDTATVTLGSAIRFSDGTSVTADDVVYSFNKAKESVYYASSLTTLLSASAANSNTVVFKSVSANSFALSCLTFPIVKENTAETAQAHPVGAGKYKYNDTTEGGELVRNTGYTAEEYNTESVVLINTADSESLVYSLVIGNLDALFDDLSSGTSQRINASTVQADINNLIYLGLNQGGALADAQVRKYLSALIERDDLISTGLEGHGVSSVSPFNPKWYAAAGSKSPSVDRNEAKEYLAAQLQNRTLNILVNADNNFKVKLAEALSLQLDDIGVKAQITSVAFDAYSAAVAAGRYDIYIGEYKLTNDMNISSLLGGEEFILQYSEMLTGNITCEDYLTAFYENPPFIPVGFRTGILAYSRSVDTEVIPLPGHPYANLHDWFI